jgi:hypothetical protein
MVDQQNDGVLRGQEGIKTVLYAHGMSLDGVRLMRKD